MYFITEGFVFDNGAFGFKNEVGGYRIRGKYLSFCLFVLQSSCIIVTGFPRSNHNSK